MNEQADRPHARRLVSHDRDAALLARVRNVASWLEVRRDRGAIEPDQYRALLKELFVVPELEAVDEFAEVHGVRSTAAPVRELSDDEKNLALDRLEAGLRRTYPGEYAGCYVDHMRFFVVGFTKDLGAQVRHIRDRFPFPTRLSGFAARYALVELEYCYVRLSRDWELSENEQITMLYRDIPANRVVVGTEGDVDATQERLRVTYGPMIDVVYQLSAQACSGA